MEELVLEVGMELDKSFKYYDKILKQHGFKNTFKCKTHDIYFTKEKDFTNLTENQIKKACVRLRNNKDKNKVKELLNQGYKKVFDTVKKDYHYFDGKIKSRIQLQKIKKIGLLVYYDNPDYYIYDKDKQRELLLAELNRYGFDFKKTDLGLDKLRTLYFHKKLYSKNQNG